MTAALLALCACGAAVSSAPAPQAAETTPSPTAEPTSAPTPAPPVTAEPVETPEPTAVPPLPAWESLQQTLYDTDCFCAALYLGRSSAPLSDALPELLAQNGLDGVDYLAAIPAKDCVDYLGDEVFVLIPRADQRIAVYNYILETSGDYDAYPGALLYSASDAAAVAVRCNESDVRADLLAVFSSSDGENRFAPRITLRDETLLAAPGVCVLTPVR